MSSESVVTAESRDRTSLSDSRLLASRQVATAPAASPRQLLLLGTVFITSFLLRLPYLGKESLWLDEVWSIATARLPWRSLLWVVRHKDSNASLYYALLHMWLHLGGSAASVRLLSVLLGLATIPVLYKLGNRLLGKPAGLIASLLLAVNQFHVTYSQEARTYSLVVLLVTISTLYFVRAVERPTGGNCCGYVLAIVLGIYAHIFGVLVPMAHVASLVFLQRRDIPWKRLIATAVAILTLASPVGILLWIRMHEPGAPLEDWVQKTSLGRILRVFWGLAGGVPFERFHLDGAMGFGLLLVVSYFVFGVIALVGCTKVWLAERRSFQSWRLALPFCLLCVPILLCIAVSAAKPCLVDKYLIVCLPGLVLIASKGIQSIMSRRSGAVAAFGLAGLAILSLLPYYQYRFRNSEWQTVTSTVLAHARPGDAIIFYVAPARLCFDHYRAELRRSEEGPEVLFPNFGNALDYLPPLPEFDRSSIERAPSRYQRVWLVLYHDEFASTKPDSQWTKAFLSAHYKLSQEGQYKGTNERVELLLYAKDKGE